MLKYLIVLPVRRMFVYFMARRNADIPTYISTLDGAVDFALNVIVHAVMNVIEVHIDNQRNASVQKVRAILPYIL